MAKRRRGRRAAPSVGDPAPSSPAEQNGARRPRRRRTWRQRTVLALGLLTSLGCLAAATAVGYARYRFEQIPRYGDITLASAATGEPQNFLLVGSDSREALDDEAADSGAFFDGTEPGGQRSDTVLVARVEPDAERVKLLSIPRDLWLPIAGTGSEDRINTAYSNGRQTLIDTIQESLGIPINHYIEVDFSGFQRLVEAIGGVPMWFDTAMRDQHTGLVINGEGCVTLDGQQALALARSRSLEYVEDGGWNTDPTGDLGRITRQQQLIVEAVQRAVSLDLTSASRFNEMIDIGVDSVGLDDALSFDDLAGLALRFRSIGPDTVINRTLPVEDYTTAGGAAVLRIVEPDADNVLAQFRGHAAADYTPGLVQVKVVNASGAEGQAEAVGNALSTIGFQFTGTENLDGLPLAVTQVHFAPGEIVAADVVARHLTTPPELVENPDIAPGTVAVVTGLDFTTVQEAARPAADRPPQVDRVVAAGDLVTSAVVEDPDNAMDVADGSEGVPITDAIGRTPGEAPPEITCR
jgi:LCP family protein required for cell wall assembly